jgi:hypothetical protein
LRFVSDAAVANPVLDRADPARARAWARDATPRSGAGPIGDLSLFADSFE